MIVASMPGPGLRASRSMARRADRWGRRLLVASTVAAGTIIVGWAVGARRLAAPIDVGHPMKLNAALGALVFGLAVLQVRARPRSPAARRVGRAVGAALALLGALTLVEHLFSWSIGIDELILQDRWATGTTAPGRPAPQSAVILLALGVALAAPAGWRRARDLAGVAGFAAAALGLMGRVLHVDAFVAIGGTYGLPATAALVFMSASLGLLLSAPSATTTLSRVVADTPGGVLLRHLIPVAVVVPLAGGSLFALVTRDHLVGEITAGWITTLAAVAVAMVLGGRAAAAADELVAGRDRYYSQLEAIITGLHLELEEFDSEGHEVLAGAPRTAVVPEGVRRSLVSAALGGEAGAQTWARDDGARHRDFETTAIPIPGEQGAVARVIAVTREVSELLDVQRRHRELFDDMAEGVVETTMEGGFLGANRAFAEMLGYDSVEELLASVDNARDLYAEAGDRAENVQHVLANGVDIIESEVVRRDGAHIWLRGRGRTRCSAGGAPASLQSIVEDITETRDSERRIRAAKERVDLAFWRNPLPLAVVHLTEDGSDTITEANPACEVLLGYGPGELLGCDPRDFVPAEELAREIAAFADVLAGSVESCSVETTRMRRDGRAVPVAVTTTTFSGEDGQRYALAAHEDLSKRNAALDALQRSFEHTVVAVANLAEVRDPYTAGHQSRVAELATLIAAGMHLDEDEQRGIWVAATIHDIGKVAIPTDILSKPGRLSPAEVELIKTHPQVGYDIVAGIEFPWPVAEMILQHHERLDGSGYPRGLRGEEIAMGSRIVAVADVVEAMTHFRPYRPGLGIDVALAEILSHRGSLYDADAVEACAAIFSEGRLDWSHNHLQPTA